MSTSFFRRFVLLRKTVRPWAQWNYQCWCCRQHRGNSWQECRMLRLKRTASQDWDLWRDLLPATRQVRPDLTYRSSARFQSWWKAKGATLAATTLPEAWCQAAFSTQLFGSGSERSCGNASSELRDIRRTNKAVERTFWRSGAGKKFPLQNEWTCESYKIWNTASFKVKHVVVKLFCRSNFFWGRL